MSTEQNKVTAGRWFSDVIMQGQLDVADEIFAAMGASGYQPVRIDTGAAME